MTPDCFNDLVALLQIHFAEVGERRALLTQALYGCPVLDQIDWHGPANIFTTNLVTALDHYGECQPGKPALVSLLETVRTRVGQEKHALIDRLIRDCFKTKGTPSMIDPTAAVGFLLEIGRWAKSELSERWTLRRKQQAADLSDKESAKETVPAMLKDAIAAQSETEAARTLALIERKRDAIDRARNAKLADREQFDRQEIPQSAFEERLKKHNATIREMLAEIESDLESLGIRVERRADK